MWTQFFDMSSGGSEKTAYAEIFIELPENEARKYFEDKFGIDPDNVTCSCCGNDFSVSEVEKEPKKANGILIIRKAEIKF